MFNPLIHDQLLLEKYNLKPCYINLVFGSSLNLINVVVELGRKYIKKKISLLSKFYLWWSLTFPVLKLPVFKLLFCMYLSFPASFKNLRCLSTALYRHLLKKIWIKTWYFDVILENIYFLVVCCT